MSYFVFESYETSRGKIAMSLKNVCKAKYCLICEYVQQICSHCMKQVEFYTKSTVNMQVMGNNERHVAKARYYNFPNKSKTSRVRKSKFSKRNYSIKFNFIDPIGRIGLNDIQKEQYNKNRIEIEIAMKAARKEIKDLEIKRSAFVFAFFLSSILLVNTFPYIVYTFPFHLSMSIYYTWKILKWEIKFIQSYKMDCNPDWRVRAITTTTKITGKVIPVFSFFSIGTIIGIDTIYEKHYGESLITKVGKWRGVYIEDNTEEITKKK